MRFERKYVSTFLAVTFAIFSSISVYQFLQVRDRVLIAAPQSGKIVNVVIAKRNVSLGAKLSLDDLKLQQWPADIHQGHYFKNIGALVGRTTKTNLFMGEPISESKLLREGENISNLIPQDMRAVTFSIRRSEMMERMLDRGSVVDVIAITGSLEPLVTKVIAQGVRVLSVSGFQGKVEERAMQKMEVTLLVSPREAGRILLAHNSGIIEITIRNDRPQTAEEVLGYA